MVLKTVESTLKKPGSRKEFRRQCLIYGRADYVETPSDLLPEPA
jgi:hypothetical protein